jgi:hypothetical protein
MMSRFFIVLITGFLFLINNSSNAQVSLGAGLGINRIKFSGDRPSNGSFAPRPGPSAGLQFTYRMNQVIGLNWQAGYVNQRSYFIKVDSNNNVSDSLTYSFDALTFPLNVMVWTPNGRFFVTAGLAMNYYLDARAHHPDRVESISSEISRFNYYAQFGAGFMISLGKPFILFEARYTQGLKDLKSSIIHEGDYLPRTKLTGLVLNVSINIPLGNTNHYKINK